MNNIKIVSLGGVREQGKNVYVIEVDDAIFVLDCGLVYPEDSMLGIDVVIPDFSYLKEQEHRIAGIFLTHGHADAVGGLPYLLQQIDAPVFGTELTIEMTKLAVKEYGLKNKLNDFHIIDFDTEIEFENVDISFFQTTHSVPDSVGIVLQTKQGAIVYTGDFKFDQSATDLYKTNFARLVEIGQKNVIALLSDSSNADAPVENDSEIRVEQDIEQTFLNATGRIIVSCVASNILRIQQVIHAAHKSYRKVFITGKTLIDTIDIALKLNKITLPEKNILCKLSELKKYHDDEIVILETGQSGEPIKELQRMAKNKHPQVNLKEGDLVYITTTPSVAFETTVAKTKDLIYRAGAQVKSVSDNINASGHATANDLKLLMNLLKPKYVMPIIGEYRKMIKHAEAAQEVGIPENHIFLLKKGEVISYQNEQMRFIGEVTTGNVLIDGNGVGDIGNIVLRDRKVLSEDGVFVAVVSISRRLGVVLSSPQVFTRGFVYIKNSSDLVSESVKIVQNVVEKYLDKSEFDWSSLRQNVRDSLSQYLFEQTRRRPVILPIIMDASGYRLPEEEWY